MRADQTIGSPCWPGAQGGTIHPYHFRWEFLPKLVSWGAIKDRARTGTSKGLSQAINRGPIRKFQPKYANVYVTIQSHRLSAGARTHYVTANGVRNGLRADQTHPDPWRRSPLHHSQHSSIVLSARRATHLSLFIYILTPQMSTCRDYANRT